ncbi:MAG TPA: response regulator [Alphaproteobacteria bacterium]|jgi:PleD family two-component response regulator
MTYELKKASILVIDDMQPMMALTASLLKILGFSDIHQASDADVGWHKFCQYNPDIVLTDWLMEPYDGLQLVKKIRNDPASPNRFVPVILMTGFSHRLRVEQARDIGVTEFLVKPFRAKDMFARVEMLIEKPRRFVETGQFFGPDRRRRKGDDYQGPFRRENDDGTVAGASPTQDADALLRKLREEAHTKAQGKK